MQTFIGLLCIVIGLAIWGVAISALVSWIVFCFGSVIIGLLLLFFAPHLLVFPLAINVPGTAAIVFGWSLLSGRRSFTFPSRSTGRHEPTLRTKTVEEERADLKRLELELAKLNDSAKG